MKTTTGQRRRGFTLVEGVVAIVILGVAMPPMLYAIRQAHNQRVSVALTSRARWLATEKLEDVIADRHSTTRGYSYIAAANYTAENPVSGHPGFTRTVTIAETAADLTTAGTGYKKVTVTVGWTDAAGVARSMAIATVVTDYTP